MITAEEYIAARTVVEDYHRQLTETIREIDHSHQVSLKSFINNVELSERLRNALTVLMKRIGNVRLEDIRPSDIANIHGVGLKSAQEFMEKQREYLLHDRSE